MFLGTFFVNTFNHDYLLEMFTNLLKFLSKVKQIMKGDEPHNVILLSAKTIIKAVSNLERGAHTVCKA